MVSKLSQQSAYLSEMGLDQWTLQCPDLLSGDYLDVKETLDDSCQLLFISPCKPLVDQILFLEKILGAMKLTIEQVRYVELDSLSKLDISTVTWVWFSGAERADLIEEIKDKKYLISPLLEHIDGNNQERRALWQQIQTQL
ncbi:DNA polymerase III subunit psi [Vibrio sp.]|nr:DNA polymerase III subunit psi [Vibrio sp.]